ncbi:MAG: OmpA family protein [bacterium]|jgi:outer membrane protein OmpA-like peptidoglycan-associated protein
MYLKRFLTVTALILPLFLLSLPAVAQEEEGEEMDEQVEEAPSKDTPYFSGMPNYGIFESNDKQFDAYTFYNGKDCTVMEGKKMFRYYTLKEGAESASETQIVRNYANAIRQMGGAVLFEGTCPEEPRCNNNSGYPMVVGKVLKGENELWVEILAFDDGLGYYITLVVKEAMKQDVTASGMFEALNRDGKVTLYINFDFGKATIRPDSRPIIEQIVQMMKTNPELMLGVEGHTDNVGDSAANILLSENRAKAVKEAIIAEKIDEARLSTVGYGEDKPVADNGTEEGRAKNRRVELVKTGKATSGATAVKKNETQFGVDIYPGAKLDAAQTKYAREVMGQEIYCYRTGDNIKEVVTFYQKQTTLSVLGEDETSALFGLDADGNSVRIAVANPWLDPQTGESHTDTMIQILKVE